MNRSNNKEKRSLLLLEKCSELELGIKDVLSISLCYRSYKNGSVERKELMGNKNSEVGERENLNKDPNKITKQ